MWKNKEVMQVVGLVILAAGLLWVTGRWQRQDIENLVQLHEGTSIEAIESPFALHWGYTIESLGEDVAPAMKDWWKEDFVAVNAAKRNPIVTDPERKILNLTVYLPLYADFTRLKLEEAKVGFLD